MRVALTLFLVDEGDDADEGSGSEAGCAVAATGVGVLASALSRGRTTDEVMAIAAPAVTGVGRHEMVTTLMSREPAPLTANAGQESAATTVTFDELLAPPPTTGGPLACLRDDTFLAVDLCFDGVIPPPVS